MPWIVGIDEAGYGPNLGPLVMSAATCQVPDAADGTDLWATLHETVRRPADPADGRLPVGDSKLIYSSARGLGDLEASVLSIVAREDGPNLSLRRLVEMLAPDSMPGLVAEPWYLGTSELPAEAEANGCRRDAGRFVSACASRQLGWAAFRSVIICPAQFNRLLDDGDSKGAVLGHALTELLSTHPALRGPGEPVWVFVDKHGGRNRYAALLQNALVDGMVVAQEEGPNRSTYRVLGIPRDVCLTFQPRADVEHFCVALASMVSKYLREVLMREFNRYWLSHVPGLKPTAGYPGDAVRYFDAIKPVLGRLGIAEANVWRRK